MFYKKPNNEILVGKVTDRMIGKAYLIENEIVAKIALQTAIENLSGEEKSVIILRFFRGLDQISVSRQLRLNQTAVARIEMKAIISMRKYFKI